MDFSFSKTRKEEEEGKLDEDSCSLSDEAAANFEDEVGESRPRNTSFSGEDDEEEESGNDEEEENPRDVLDEAELDVRVHIPNTMTSLRLASRAYYSFYFVFTAFLWLELQCKNLACSKLHPFYFIFFSF